MFDAFAAFIVMLGGVCITFAAAAVAGGVNGIRYWQMATLAATFAVGSLLGLYGGSQFWRIVYPWLMSL